MEPAGLSSRYGARRLCDSDVGAVYRLSAGNPIFYKYCPPCVTLESIREDMKVLPPGKSGEDKFYVGFFDGSMLTAVMDLILKYPNDETAFIGLFCTLSFGSLSDFKMFGKNVFDLLDFLTSNVGMPLSEIGFSVAAAWIAWKVTAKQLTSAGPVQSWLLWAIRIVIGILSPLLIVTVVLTGLL